MMAIENFQSILLALLFSSARIGATFIIAPFFGSELIPGLARNLTIFSMTLIVVPATLAVYPSLDLDALTFVAILVKEILIGFFMGFIVGIAFHIAENVGAFIDTQRGSSMGQIFDPMSGSTSTTLGALFVKIIVLLFFVGGGFMAFMGFVYHSYKIWPIFSFYPEMSPLFPSYFLGLMDSLMRYIVVIAAPVAIVLFMSEFGLGLMNRFASQLNVFSLSMPVKSGIAMFMFIIYMSILFELLKIQIHKGEIALKHFQTLLT